MATVDARARPRCAAAALVTLVWLAAGAARAELVINEIDYDQGAGDSFEVLEIKNVGSEPQSLSDWDLEIVPGSRGNLPPVSIPPGGYFVVCGLLGLPTPCDVRFLRADILPDSGAEIRLLDPNGVIAVSTTYAAGPPEFVDPGAASNVALARCPDGDPTAPFVPVPLTNRAPNACDGFVAPIVPDAGTVGDQLLYFYDARPGRTTFLSVGNPSPDPAWVEIVFYAQGLEIRLAEETVALAGGGARVVDPILSAGVAGHAGLATVTPIVGEGDHTPVVLRRPLVGGYTIANLELGAGFGQNPFGRLAVPVGPDDGGDVPRAAPGSLVDGARVRFQTVDPGGATPAVVVPTYFDPAALAPVAQDGNRLLLASFGDEYGAPVGPDAAPRFRVVPRTRDLTVRFLDDDGGVIVGEHALAVGGVRLDSLQGLAGGPDLVGPGRVEIALAPAAAARTGFLGLFGQALGTFAVGQRLPALAPLALAAPTEALGVGDQLLYLYDARAGRTTFVTVGNPNQESVTVEVVFHSQSLTARLAESTLTIPGGGVRVIDPTAGAFAGAAGNAGLATVTPVAGTDDHLPVLHARPLTGSFTIVNLALGAGFGQNPFGRLAVDAGGVRPTPSAGATVAVDGATVAYQAITPPTSPRASGSAAPTLTVPVYFNPQVLSPAVDDGNRLILASFFDAYGVPVGPGGAPRFTVAPASQGATVRVLDDAGTVVRDDGSIVIDGVLLTDLQTLAGGLVLDRPGRVELRMAPAPGTSVLGIFSQAVGTFAVGQRLPPIDFD